MLHSQNSRDGVKWSFRHSHTLVFRIRLEDKDRNLFERKLGVPLYHIQHRQADIAQDSYGWSLSDWEVPYKKLAIHYGWALEQVFSGSAYVNRKHTRTVPTPPLPKRAIILEEDIEINVFKKDPSKIDLGLNKKEKPE